MTLFLLSWAFLLLLLCSHTAEGTGPNGTSEDLVEGFPGSLRFNEVQMVTSHNSYRRRFSADSALFGLIDQYTSLIGVDSSSLAYDHEPLLVQLEKHGLRGIELDIFADPDGGKYATPVGLPLQTDTFMRPEMFEPGWKVMHVQDIDFHSSCQTLRSCLSIIREWSDARSGNHLPIQIHLELKDEPQLPSIPPWSFEFPLPITQELIGDMEAEVREIIPESQIITPRQVQGNARTLKQALVLGDGWPTLREAKGKFLFFMVNPKQVIEHAEYVRYKETHPDALLFLDSEESDDDAAFFKREAFDEVVDIPRLVQQGYYVRTLTDTPAVESQSGDTTRRDACFVSGAQNIGSDYYARGAAKAQYGTDYVVELADPTGGAPNARAISLADVTTFAEAPTTTASSTTNDPLTGAPQEVNNGAIGVIAIPITVMIVILIGALVHRRTQHLEKKVLESENEKKHIEMKE